jgi:hypothetical protein
VYTTTLINYASLPTTVSCTFPPSGKTFKAIPVGLADGALEGRLGAGTQVTANLAAPNRDTTPGKTDQLFPVLLGRWLLLGASALWHRLHLFFASSNLLRDIKSAIAGTVLIQIGVAVVTGTDNVQVFFPDPIGQAAGTGPVAISLLVGQKPLHQVKDKLDVRVEIVARRLPLALQTLIQRLSFL